METYDYREQICGDIRDYINGNYDKAYVESLELNKDEFYERLNDELWVADSVTGNASGSYFCNSYKAHECLFNNWDLLAEAMNMFCCEKDAIKEGAEWADVIIRCYLLGECLGVVLDELEEEGFFETEEEEEETED